MASLREIPDEINPLTRLRSAGVDRLSNGELLAVLIGNLRGGSSPLDTANDTIMQWGSLHSLGRLGVQELVRQYGFTEHVATRLVVAAELGKRMASEEKPYQKKITSPTDFYETYCHEMRFLGHEELRVACFNVKMQLLGFETIYRGSVHTTVIRVGEVFRPAILLNASSVIVAHNHPSGDPTPSPEDSAVTRDMNKLARTLDIELLDHIVVGSNTFVSMKERGLGF